MATITLDKQLDSEQFLLIPRVPIFREHYLRLPDGRTLYFDRVKLQQIAEVQRSTVQRSTFNVGIKNLP
ncbi:hypothetical protein THTE_2660 [Thermogutta terrifontis]|uniref:Uncharacterized protein n=1 Tax=Thermogutta terrifontis TaxID=1331910 RepID=A0A286RH45_9BACT|nr:hypothetical protein [Thermogutta terrifontis]ASV75262.1 hypothetical protein THTE_2660 [Thermogutta terrifontis]